MCDISSSLETLMRPSPRFAPSWHRTPTRGTDLWQVNKEEIVGPDFETYSSGFASHALVPMIFGFLAAWWPLRHEPNVMFVHYADLKREPEASIRRVAEFLGFDVPDGQWPAIFEYTSFEWMKAHEDKFELRSVYDIPMLDSGANDPERADRGERRRRDHSTVLRDHRRDRPNHPHRPTSVGLVLPRGNGARLNSRGTNHRTSAPPTLEPRLGHIRDPGPGSLSGERGRGRPAETPQHHREG